MTWISPGASYGALKASIVIAGTALDSVRTPAPDTAGAFSAACRQRTILRRGRRHFGEFRLRQLERLARRVDVLRLRVFDAEVVVDGWNRRGLSHLFEQPDALGVVVLHRGVNGRLRSAA